VVVTYSPGEDNENNEAKVGVSARPYLKDGTFSIAKPFVTAANFTHKKGSWHFQAGIPDLLFGNNAYNTAGKMTCPCGDNGPPDKTASLAGFHMGDAVLETNGLGGALNYTTAKYMVTVGDIAALQSDIFKPFENVGYLYTHYNYIHTKLKLMANVAASAREQSYNIGAQKWFSSIVNARVNFGTLQGQEKEKRLDALVLLYPTQNNTFSLGVAYSDVKKESVAATWTTTIKDKWFVNTRVSSDFHRHDFSIGLYRHFEFDR
jgi:hypothetical protein